MRSQPKTKAKPGPKAGATKTAPKKPAATKAAPKKATIATKTKPGAPKKRAKEDSENESEDDSFSRASAHDDTLLSNTPPSNKKPKKAPAPKKMGAKPLREIENDAINEAIDASLILDGADEAKPKKGAKGAKSTEQYQKVRPD